MLSWIHAAGGHSVLAHPARYRLNRSKLVRLVRAFTEAGGHAIEVVSGRQDPSTTRQLATLASEYGLAASSGTDFHGPDQVWLKPGAQAPLPPDCEPVWHRFGTSPSP